MNFDPEIRKAETRLYKLQAEAGELLKVETRSEEESARLDACMDEIREAKQTLEAAKELAPANPEPEAVELREMIRGAKLANIVEAVVSGTAPDGRERELQAELGIKPNAIPLDLLRDPAPVETRGVTAAPSDTGQSQAEILGYVFPQAAGAFLGFEQPTVPVGARVYPVLGTGATATAAAKDAEVSESDGTFSATVLSPKRLQAAFIYRREDAAEFAGMSEALRRNLAGAIQDGLDKAAIAAVEGLTAATGTSAAGDFAAAKTAFYEQVDGRYASMASDVRGVVGTDTYQTWATYYRNPNVNDDALQHLRTISGGFRVSAHVAATDATSKKQNVLFRKGMRMGEAVQPLWASGVELIPDSVTLASNGQVKITAILLHNTAVIRSGAYTLYPFQLRS